jgi:hypothetical protein
MMLLQEVARATRVLSMVGARAITQLHHRSGVDNGAMRGRRRVKKKKSQGRSRWSRAFSKGR